MTVPGPIAIDEAAIGRRIAEIAAAIGEAHPLGVVLLPILPEAGRFACDLAIAIGTSVDVDPIRISAYRPQGPPAVLTREIDLPLEGRDAIIVAGVLDTGLRVRFALTALAAQAGSSLTGSSLTGSSLTVCALLDRPDRRLVPLPIEHVAFQVPDCLFAGYGLGRARGHDHLPAIHFADHATAERARRQHLAIA